MRRRTRPTTRISQLAATSDSTLPVTFTSAGVCTNANANFTMTSGTGTCTVKYDQAGDGNYNAATQVTESVTAQKANQTITANPHAPANATYNTSFTVGATSDSGLPVTFSSAGVCTNASATFTMTSGTGTCTVKYDQAGDGNYNAATQVTESVTRTESKPDHHGQPACTGECDLQHQFHGWGNLRLRSASHVQQCRSLHKCGRDFHDDERHGNLHGEIRSGRRRQLQCGKSGH